MIDRYSFCTEASLRFEGFKSYGTVDIAPIYLACPTQQLPIIMANQKHDVQLMYWGVHPAFAKKKAVSEKLISIKIEKLLGTRRLKLALSKRGIIPADSFYAWKKISKKRSIAHRFVLPNENTFAIPAIWEMYENEAQEKIYTFKWLTVSGLAEMEDYSDNIPKVLDKKRALQWLDPYTTEENLETILSTPDTFGFKHYTVSHLIAEPSFNKIEAIKEVPAIDNLGNYNLFG